MPQIFRPAADTIIRCVLAAAILVPLALIGLAYAFARSPHVTDQEIVVQQPVPFSHQHHVGGLGLDCRYCHTGVEQSSFAGVPPTETCMTCHSQIWTNAAMLAPVRKSLATGLPIHWQRVHRLPGYVYFDHSIHVAKGVGCTTCHGRRRQDASHLPGRAADHGVVPRLPPQSGESLAREVRGLLDRLEAGAGPGGAGPQAACGIRHQGRTT